LPEDEIHSWGTIIGVHIFYAFVILIFGFAKGCF
jgi:hypothetical protein